MSQNDSTFGCLFISVIFTSALWGVGCLQLYLYYEKYWKTDQPWLKTYILLIWIMDTVHQALVSHFNYVYFVKGIANISLRDGRPKTGADTIVFTALIDAMIQSILIRRAWYLSSKNNILAGVLSAAVLAQFSLTLTYYGQVINLNRIAQLDDAIHTELAMTGVAVFTDTLLAVVLIWLLRKARSGFRRSDSIVNRLVMYIVGSSLVTAMCVIVALISAAVAPHSFIYLLADLVIPKLYFNCMLASLNARSRLRETLENGETDISICLENVASVTSGGLDTPSATSQKASSPTAMECRIGIGSGLNSEQRVVRAQSKIHYPVGV
ncbi:hypothetical protein ACEPAI_2461 [Sanghuangporus weigelae]